MKHLLKLTLAGLFCLSVSAASAQTQNAPSKDQAAENYDNWKQTNTITQNTLVATDVDGDYTTHVIRVAKKLTDATAADAYKTKISAHPGIISVSVDHNTKTATVVVKSEDEHQVLLAAFDIQ